MFYVCLGSFFLYLLGFFFVFFQVEVPKSWTEQDCGESLKEVPANQVAVLMVVRISMVVVVMVVGMVIVVMVVGMVMVVMVVAIVVVMVLLAGSCSVLIIFIRLLDGSHSCWWSGHGTTMVVLVLVCCGSGGGGGSHGGGSHGGD